MADGTVKPVFFSGVDLGQTTDPSAVVILERTLADDPEREGKKVAVYEVRHLHRWRLGTGYPAIVSDVVDLFANPPLAGSTLAVDQTGVGRPVVDMLRQARPDAYLRPITITAGHTATSNDRGECLIPKVDLVAVAVWAGERNLIPSGWLVPTTGRGGAFDPMRGLIPDPGTGRSGFMGVPNPGRRPW